MSHHPLYDYFLYFLCTVIWGSTWIVIKFQIDTVSPIVGVFYRFVLAATFLFAFCTAARVRLRWSPRQHSEFFLQGVFNFSINYMLTYVSEMMASSGLIALTFTSIIYLNMFGMRVFFRQPIRWNVIAGSILGGGGLLMIFMNELDRFQPGSKSIWGLMIGLIAAVFASAGNMMSTRILRQRIPVAAANAWGMLYGTLFTGLTALLLNQNFSFEPTLQFGFSLLYLAFFGTVIAFGAYISLVGRIGAEKAAYTSVLSPVLALWLSSLYEEFHFTPMILLGMVLCLAGNFLTLKKTV